MTEWVKVWMKGSDITLQEKYTVQENNFKES